VTKEEWKARIEPHLSHSLSTVADRITQAQPVQSWLRQASTQAAETLHDKGGLQGQMKEYSAMKATLDDTLPALVAALDELTYGWGHLEVDLRPFNPSLSRLFVDTEGEFSVQLFYPLSNCSPRAVNEVFDTVSNGLPDDEPFPNRPNQVTGFVARAGAGLGVRLKDHLDHEGNRYRSIALLIPEGETVEGLSVDEAKQELRQHLCTSSDDARS